MVVALERAASDDNRLVYHRFFWVVASRWVLGDTAVSDHRGLIPTSAPKLSERNTDVVSRPILVDSGCYLADELGLTSEALFNRDSLLPAPRKNFGGIAQREVRYDAACVTMSRLLRSLKVDDKFLLSAETPSYRTLFIPGTNCPAS